MKGVEESLRDVFEGFERIESLGIMRGLVLNFLYLPDSVDVSNPVSASRRRRSFQEHRYYLRMKGIRSCIRRERIEETGRTGRGGKSACEGIHLHLL